MWKFGCIFNILETVFVDIYNKEKGVKTWKASSHGFTEAKCYVSLADNIIKQAEAESQAQQQEKTKNLLGENCLCTSLTIHVYVPVSMREREKDFGDAI